MNKTIQVTAVVCCLALAACASDKKRDAKSSSTRGASSSSTTSPYGAGGAATPRATTPSTDAAGMPDARVVYFEFDSSELRPEGVALVDAWANYLSKNPDTKVRLEGHADERGTREYNVGLGERRALSVRDALTSRGVSARQLGVASFGEERPVALGHEESAWSQNRRVEIVQ